MAKHSFIMVVACMALLSWAATAGEVDFQALRAQVLAQRQELNDLRAKVAQDRACDGATADELTSLRKNATVTLGGTVNTRYYYRQGTVKSRLDPNTPGAILPERAKREDFKGGDLTIADAKMEMKIDVNDHFDAYLKLDFQDAADRANVSGIAENYWIRWKNICNSGFGLLVGRDKLKFGDEQPIGVLDSWTKDAGGSFGDITRNSGLNNWDNGGNGMLAHGNLLPAHTTYNWSRTTQINPYWESSDGRLRIDVSLLQSVDRLGGWTGTQGTTRAGGVTRYRSINYGLGSATARVQWKPIEGLKLTASAMNLTALKRGSNFTWGPTGAINGGFYGADTRVSTHNTSVNLAVQWRPCFLPRLNLWAQGTHGWNEAWVSDMDSLSANAGASYDLTDSLTVFAQGDYLRTLNRQSDNWNRATGWAVYAGAVYTLPYGVNFEAGWRHERMDYTGKTLGKHTKVKADTVYAHLGFNY